jgi:hypothetical protein
MPLISALQDIAAADAVGVGTFDLVGAAYKPAALTGDVTVTVKYPAILSFDAGAAGRAVTLEAEAGAAGRVRFIINHGAANDLTVKNDAGATIATVTQDRGALVYCDGTAWTSLGIVTIA